MDSLEFLRAIQPEGPWCLTSIEPDKPYINTMTFLPGGEEEMAAWIRTYNGNRNIYWHVNRVRRVLSSKANREDILSVDLLHVDIDPRAGEDLTRERQRARSLLEDPPGLPRPSVVLFSGGGYQAFWRLEDPIQIGGDLAKAEEAKRYNQQIELLLGGDNCHNIDRLCRLPGTWNLPDRRKRAKGRVRELATVEWFEPSTYPLSGFTKAPLVQSPVSGMFSGSSNVVEISGNVPRLGSIDDLEKWEVPDRIKVIIVQGRHPDEEPKRDDSRSAWLFDCVCGLLRAEVPDEVVYSIITDPDFAISASVLDKGSRSESYAIRQIERAKEEAIDPALRELNELHAVIGNIGGKCRIIEEVEEDDGTGRSILSFQSFQDFRNRYLNRQVKVGQDKNGNPKYQPLGAWWLGHENRRQYRSVVFTPGKTVAGAYNMWRGFVCEARPGELHLSYLQHVRENICGGSEANFQYLLKWMARGVQYPYLRGEVAIVLRGRQGTGKTFAVDSYGHLFGRHYFTASDSRQLIGNFNAHLRDVKVVNGEESFYAGDKRHESSLKVLITGKTLPVEGKGLDIVSATNYLNIFMLSNAGWVIPAGIDERRFFVLDVGDEHLQDKPYFEAIQKELDSGGYEHLLHHLLGIDLTDFDVRSPPMTEALLDQKRRSLPSEVNWWLGLLEDGRLLPEHDHWMKEAQKDALIESLVEWIKNFGNRGDKITPQGMGRFLSRVVPEGGPTSYQKVVDGLFPDSNGSYQQVRRRRWHWGFPSLSRCREHFDTVYPIGVKWKQVDDRPGELPEGKEIY